MAHTDEMKSSTMFCSIWFYSYVQSYILGLLTKNSQNWPQNVNVCFVSSVYSRWEYRRDIMHIRMLLLYHYLTKLHFYFQHLRKVSKFIATQNERVYNPKGIHITDPILRGLRVIEITIIELPNYQSPTGNNTAVQIRHTWPPHENREFFM